MHRIRWDRVGRVALLCVLVVVVGLYIGPARSYWSARGEAKEKREQVQRLEARRKALTTPATLEAEARKLGYVMPGEKAYVIEDLPAG
jgi:cell division protein FtsB